MSTCRFGLSAASLPFGSLNVSRLPSVRRVSGRQISLDPAQSAASSVQQGWHLPWLTNEPVEPGTEIGRTKGTIQRYDRDGGLLRYY
jgi:hypothetical protein